MPLFERKERLKDRNKPLSHAMSIAAVHKKFVDDVHAHYKARPRVYGNLDAPLPPLPPFTPHNDRLWLIWSSIMVALLLALPLLVSLVGDARKLWVTRFGRHRAKVRVSDDVLRRFKEATGQSSQEALTRLRATAAFSPHCEIDADLALTRFHVELESLDDDDIVGLEPASIDNDQLAAQANANLNHKLKVDRLMFVGKLCLFLAALGYGVLAIEQAMSSNSYAVLGVSQSASADEVRRAFRRQAALLHPDAGEQSSESLDRLQILQTARDEILHFQGAPLQLAFPEMTDNSIVVAYTAFLASAMAGVFCLTKCWLLDEKPVPRGHFADGLLEAEDFQQT
jgi:DnaJ-domain-containing protein 1